ncbi:hypothetical protein AAVH_21638 [Aphelenchoides avenae]|nr:hypothetical protein AAVH_21638 [Aphelenchus avenae]
MGRLDLLIAIFGCFVLTAEAVFECPADGLFPNPENCDSFFRCVSGTPYLQYCPASLKFSKETQECVWPEIANCSEEPGF